METKLVDPEDKVQEIWDYQVDPDYIPNKSVSKKRVLLETI